MESWPLLRFGAATAEDDFRTFFARYEPRVRRVAAAYARQPADREDLVQDIALSLWRARSQFRAECSEQTFVYRVAHNVALKYALRKRWPLVNGESPEVESAEPSPHDALTTLDETEQLQRAVATLPLGEREVIVLALEGLTNTEIADITGLREKHVAVRLFRAKARLREKLLTKKRGDP